MWEERLWNKITLLREKCLCVRLLSFLVTIEWNIRVYRVIHYLEWLQSCNHSCDSEIFLRRFCECRQEISNHVQFLCLLLFFLRYNLCVFSRSFVDVSNFIYGRVEPNSDTRTLISQVMVILIWLKLNSQKI